MSWDFDGPGHVRIVEVNVGKILFSTEFQNHLYKDNEPMISKAKFEFC